MEHDFPFTSAINCATRIQECYLIFLISTISFRTPINGKTWIGFACSMAPENRSADGINGERARVLQMIFRDIENWKKWKSSWWAVHEAGDGIARLRTQPYILHPDESQRIVSANWYHTVAHRDTAPHGNIINFVCVCCIFCVSLFILVLCLRRVKESAQAVLAGVRLAN